MILVFGGVTGGLGQPLHQALCAMYGDSQVVMSIGRKHCDLESEESIGRFWNAGFSFSGKLHVINATGVSISAMIHKAEVGDIGRMIRVNLVSNVLLLKHARALYKQHGGTFTMIGSVTADTGPIGTAVYSASKGALSALARVAAKEFAPFGTRVNVLESGYLNKGMIQQLSMEQLSKTVGQVPLQRLGYVSDIVEACRFLIDCDYVTGATIKVNGGL